MNAFWQYLCVAGSAITAITARHATCTIRATTATV